MKCEHKNTINVESYKDVAGLRFEYDTDQCQDCNKVLWSSEHESLFREWLNEQKQIQKDRFTVQKVQVQSELTEFARQLAERHHCSESNVYRACLALYFVWGQRNPEQIKYLDSLSIPESTHSIKKFRIRPSMLVRLDANAKLFDMHMNEVASWAIQRVLIAAKAGAEEKNLILLSEIEYALEAA